jgi:hypothetical protein
MSCSRPLFVFLMVCSTAFSQSKIDVRVLTDRDRISLGQELTYSLIIRYPNRVTLVGDPTTHFENFEITQIKKYEPTEESGFQTLQYDYGLTTFTVDTFLIGAPNVTYLSGRDTLTVQGSSRRVIVAGTIDSTVKDIQPEKPLLEAKINWWLLMLYLIGFAAFIAASIYFGIKAYRKYKQRKLLALEEDDDLIKKTPEEWALEQLDRVKDRQLIENDAFKEFHIEVSNIIRVYLEQKFSILALESTTSELIHELQQRKSAEENYIMLLRRFLEVCDLVKFAKYRASSRECYDVLNDAYGMVKYMAVKNMEEAKA